MYIDSYVDCVNDSHLYQHDMNEIREVLKNKLPSIRLAELPSILMIQTKFDTYCIKNRFDYSTPMARRESEKRIKESDFKVINKNDLGDLSDWINVAKTVQELIPENRMVVYDLSDLDVDSLIQ